MKTLFLGILISVIIFIILQTIMPFPYGLIFGIVISAILIWRAAKVTDTDRFSLLGYRRVDPKTTKEFEQNKEAFRILKKKYLDGEISKEEFDTLKTDFDGVK